MMKTIRFIAICLIIAILSSFTVTFAQEDRFDPFGDDKDVNVVFLGGSATEAEGFRLYIGDYIKNTFEPLKEGRTITNYNAGIGGTTSEYGLLRLNRDVISKNPDMVFIDFACNDKDQLEKTTIDSMEGIIRNLQSLENPPMICLIYYTGKDLTKTVAPLHQRLADYYNIPVIDFVQCMKDLGYTPGGLDASIDNYYIEDGVHANSLGYRVFGEYAVDKLKNREKEFFRHPVLRQSPLSSSQRMWVNSEYVTAKEAMDKGTLKVENYDTSDNAVILHKNGKLSYDFSGKLIAASAKRGKDGGIVKYSVSDSSAPKTGEIDTQFTIAMETSTSCTYFNLKDEKHTLSMNVDVDANVRVEGFFVNEKEERVYPKAYPQDANINVWVDTKDEKVDNTDYSMFDFAKGLEFIDVQHDSINEKTTRAQFAQAMHKFLTYTNENYEADGSVFLGNDNNKNIVEPTVENDRIYEDVEKSDDNYDAICFMKNLGLMVGDGDGRFFPTNTINTKDAVRVFTNILGYGFYARVISQDKNEYLKIANSIGLLKNVDVNGELTFDALSKMLYNAFFINAVEFKYVYNRYTVEISKVLFVERYLDIFNAKGILDGNEYTTLFSQRENNAKVEIAGKTYYVDENHKYVNDLIGRDVDAYFDGDKRLLYVHTTNKDRVVDIDASNEPEYNNHVISYITENGARKTIRIENSDSVILNGGALKSYLADDFNIVNGNIRIIYSNDQKIVIITKYDDCLLTSVDLDNEKLYLKGLNGENTEFSLKDITIVGIYDENNKELTLDDLKQNDVLSMAINDKLVKIIRSRKVISDYEVSAQEQKDDKKTILHGGAGDFELLSKYTSDPDFPSITVGSSYMLYLNFASQIVWVKFTGTMDNVSGVVQKIWYDQDDICKIRIYANDAKVHNYSCASKTRVIDSLSNDVKYTNQEELYKNIKDVTGFITFDLNSKGEMQQINIPISDLNVKINGTQVYDISKAYGYTNKSYIFGNYQNKSGFVNATGRIFYKDGKTTFFFVPDSASDSSSYIVTTNSSEIFKNDNKYTIEAYTTSNENTLADYVIVRKSDSSVTSAFLFIGAVTKISEGIYNDMLCDKITCYQMNAGTIKEVSFYAEKDMKVNEYGENVSVFGAVNDPLYSKNDVGNPREYKIEKGDIVIYNISAEDENKVSDIYMLYKKTMTPPDDSTAKPGWLAGTNSVFDFSSNFNNPYSINENVLQTAAGSADLTAWGKRVMFGYVMSFDNSILKITTENLKENKFSGVYNNYGTNMINLSYIKNYIVDYTNEIQVVPFDEAKIKTYKNTNSDATRAIAITNGGTSETIVFIND